MAQARSRASRSKRTTRPAATPPGESPPPICSVGFCPICLAVATVSEVRPEFIEHLTAAGKEFLLAVRAVIDARLEGMEPPVTLERLTIE
jgi:hypothetical protein